MFLYLPDTPARRLNDSDDRNRSPRTLHNPRSKSLLLVVPFALRLPFVSFRIRIVPFHYLHSPYPVVARSLTAL